MHEVFHGLTNRPFPSVPSTDTYFAAEPIENARQTLLRAIERAQGPSLLIGPSGTGKSLLLTLLDQQFRSRFRVVTLANTKLCSRRALLQNILFELRLPYRDMEEGELRLSLIDALEPSEVCPHGLLLLVDEAHTLPVQLLEELRMITNLVRDDQPRVRLVLAGGAKLEERLADPSLESLNQRVAARCYLEPFTAAETRQYVEHQIRWAGGRPEEIFTEDSFSAVWAASDGVPRLVNQLCDHALILSAAYDSKPITRAGIEEAWADLQQLPTPSQTEDSDEDSMVIEFGSLDDESADEDGPSPSSSPASNRFEVIADEGEPEAESSGDVATIELSPAEESVASLETPPSPTPSPALEPAVNEPQPPTIRHDEIFGSFAEEELVLDRFASFDSQVWNARPKVRSDESRSFAEALGQAVDSAAFPASPSAEATSRATDSGETPLVFEYPAPGTPTPTSTGQESDAEARRLHEFPADGEEPEDGEEPAETPNAEFHPFPELLVEAPEFQFPAAADLHLQIQEAESLPIGPQWGVWIEEAAALDTDGEVPAEWVDDLKIVEYQQIDPATDPVHPAPVDASTESIPEAEESSSPISDAQREPVEDRTSVPFLEQGESVRQDDRDLIVMEEDQFQGRVRNEPAGRARREDYRRLFGKLRQNS